MSLFKQWDKSVYDFLLSADLQHKCKFEFVFVRNPVDQFAGGGLSTGAKIIKTAVASAGLATDILIAKFFAETIQFPGGIKFETVRINQRNHVRSIQYPGDMMVRFIETEDGFVRRYITEWTRSIASPYMPTDVGSALQSFNPLRGVIGSSKYDPKEGSYEFDDNQNAAKRSVIILLKPKDGIDFIPKYPRIMIYGALIKGEPDYELAQSNPDHLTYDINFSIDEVKVPLGF